MRSENAQIKNSLTPRLLFVLGTIGGITVANLYYVQPLLSVIAGDLGISAEKAGLVSTVIQFGYALGIFFLIPLGDFLEKKRLLLILSILSSGILFLFSLQTNVYFLYAAGFCIGVVSVSPQIIVPITAGLASPNSKGKSIGIVVSGILIGILCAWPISGGIGALLSWRSVFIFASIFMLCSTFLIWKFLPIMPTMTQVKYLTIIKSIPFVFLKYRLLRMLSGCGFFIMFAFGMLMATLAFKLTSSPFYYETGRIGLFGLLGIGGAIGTTISGRVHNVLSPKIISAVSIIVGMGGFMIMCLLKNSIIVIAIGVFMIHFGIQAAQVTNQTLITNLSDTERSRTNSIFVVCNFFGIANGSYFGGLIWEKMNWEVVCIGGCAVMFIGLIFNLLGRANIK